MDLLVIIHLKNVHFDALIKHGDISVFSLGLNRTLLIVVAKTKRLMQTIFKTLSQQQKVAVFTYYLFAI